MTVVTARCGDAHAGYVEFVHQRGKLRACNLEVATAFRRQGLATAMYVFAETHTGMRAVPHDDQSADGQAFWAQNKRPFGI